jgi:hypothetical protein
VKLSNPKKFLFFFCITEETNLSDVATNSPVIGSRINAVATLPISPPAAVTSHSHPQSTTPVHPATTPGSPSSDWPSQSDEDIDRLVAMHQNRHNSLGSLGVSFKFSKITDKFQIR